MSDARRRVADAAAPDLMPGRARSAGGPGGKLEVRNDGDPGLQKCGPGPGHDDREGGRAAGLVA
jgi:hypothetical protein